MTNLSGIIISILAAIAYGIYPPAAKLAFADGANSVFIVLTTTFCRATVFLIYCLIKNQSIVPLPGKMRVAISGGFFQAFSVACLIYSLKFLPGPVVIIIIFTHTIMLLFYLAYKKEIELTAVALTSTFIALVGLSFVLDIWNQESNINLIGLCLSLAAAVATTSRIYIFGKQTLTIPPAVVGAQTFSSALFFLVLLTLFQRPIFPESSTGYLWTLVCCVSLSLGTFGMLFAIARIGSFRSSLFLKVEPIFTSIFSLLLLKEALQSTQYFGMLLVIGSLFAFQLLEKRTKTVPEQLISTDPQGG